MDMIGQLSIQVGHLDLLAPFARRLTPRSPNAFNTASISCSEVWLTSSAERVPSSLV